MKKLHVPMVDTTAAELALAGVLMLWGVWLLMPWQAFGTGFDTLANFLPESTVGLLAVVIASVRMIGGIKDRFVVTTTLASGAFWAAITGALAATRWYSTGVGMYGSMAVVELIVVALNTPYRLRGPEAR